MALIYCDTQRKHSPKTFVASGTVKPCPENATRAEVLLAQMVAAGRKVEEPGDHGEAPIMAVHDRGYVEFLKEAYRLWKAVSGSSEEVTPNVHPTRHAGRKIPRGIVGKAGYYLADLACPIGEHSWEGIYWSAQSAIHAAKKLLEGDVRSCYALCRPPGHHAYADMAGGFCFLNNSAIAAQYLLDHSTETGKLGKINRVAILDVDVHHGNGTQNIFYKRSDVLFCSLHGDPDIFYPWYLGYQDEIGEEDGIGYNINVPLPKNTSDDEYIAALLIVLQKIKEYDPQVLVVSLGLDASEKDPFQFMKITTKGFGQIGKHIAMLNLPTLLIQEGGYLSDILGNNAVEFVQAFEQK